MVSSTSFGYYFTSSYTYRSSYFYSSTTTTCELSVNYCMLSCSVVVAFYCIVSVVVV
jgi:hypothetical protein